MSLDLYYFTGGPRKQVLEAIIEAGHRIRHVFPNSPGKWPKVASTIEYAKNLDIPVTVIERKSDLDDVADIIADGICFSAGFAYLFPKAFLDSISVCINVHGSLLPHYAGARTLSWVIENGEVESGVTVHLVDEGMDTGPIILQRAFPLSPFDTTASLARKTAEFEPDVVVDALAKFEALGLDGCEPQPKHKTPALPNRIPEHSRIDPALPLADLINKIRASNIDHYPAFFDIHGQKVCIQLWRPNKPVDETDLL